MDVNYKAYLREDLSEFLGEWVAIVRGKIVAHDKNPKIAYKEAIKKGKGAVPLLAKVPAEEVLVV